MLSHLTVIEVAEGVAGPVAGMQLADLGAVVIKVEPPHGDRSREWGVPTEDGSSAIFGHLNRGKKSVVLDLGLESGREGLERLLRRADAVIVDMDPEEAAEWGIDWSLVSKRHEQLVVCLVNDFGHVGPFANLPGSELTVQALSGFTRYIGEPGGAPCRVGYEIAGVGAGMHIYQAILAGLFAREAQGRGQIVRLSKLQALLSLKAILLAAQSAPDDWNGFHLNGPMWHSDTGWSTKDGQVTFDFRHGQRDAWVKFCERLGLSHLVDHPDYEDWRSTIYIGDRRLQMGGPYRDAFSKMTSDEVSSLINGLGGISVKFNDYAELLAHEQTAVVDPFVSVQSDDGESRTQVGTPFRFADISAKQTFDSAPRLGQHTEEVLASLTAGADA